VAFRILSIDGGGIRGLIPAVILSELERITGQPTSALFDLIAGTSTGGILALGLAKPDGNGAPAFSAQELVSLYEHEGGRIFSRSLPHWLLSLNRLAGAKYPATGLTDVLARYFGETMLSEALTDVVVPSYDIEQRLPIYFTSYFARARPGFDHKMKHVARSTSSAPTYFEPFRLKTTSEVDHLSVIDGGVFANNPTLAAIAEATGSHDAALDDLVIVSLGTGKGAQPLPIARGWTGWGLAGWSTRILDVVLDSVSESVHHQVYYLLRGTSQRNYFRLEPALNKGERRLDKATDDNIRRLIDVATRFVGDERQQLEKICGLLED